MLNVDEIVKLWEQDEPIYKEIEDIVVGILKDELLKNEILTEVSSRTKDLCSTVKKIKKKSAQKEYSYAHLKDRLGVRIICTFESELNIVDGIINANFIVHSSEFKKIGADYQTLNYQSNHYDVSINPNNPKFSKIANYKDYIFEIQVRTLNQHAWANASHKLTYKRDDELPDDLQRKLYRLLALYELADQEIQNIKDYISNEENVFMHILSKIEGKFYKYAKVDYDREITLDSLMFLEGIFPGDNITALKNEIENFIAYNEEKIEAIFEENRLRFHEIPALTQPEIFIIWYALENFEHTLTDNWSNHFDTSDLDHIKILWGGDTE